MNAELSLRARARVHAALGDASPGEAGQFRPTCAADHPKAKAVPGAVRGGLLRFGAGAAG
ncbi:hypothetical protein ACQP2P_21205 [Dactylosporangium sp. CA-139114]|uniref:hypothetical protein n=1 Tax=Dactylosporangium sp. CA-139114 TaxID=3239931 RepID=UPI003D98784F